MNLPLTEQENPRTVEIDRIPTLAALHLINDEDKVVATAVEKVLPEIAAAVDKIVARLGNGGRLFYVGSGTSGRLGVLDAAECPPTFGVAPEIVQGVIAGGWNALYQAVEGIEDDAAAGRNDLQNRGITALDAVVGIAASGRTPYTIGALAAAQELKCFTACITCNPDSAITKVAEIAIVPIVGAEVIAGSSRMKAGTAQKMIINMISTASMMRLGKVTGNRMTNVQSTNQKLKERALRILMAETNLDESTALNLLLETDYDLTAAIEKRTANSTKVIS